MPGRLTLLYYDVANTKWIELKSRSKNPSFNSSNPPSASNAPYVYNGGSPVLQATINDTLGAPMEAVFTITNRQEKPTQDYSGSDASNPLVNGQLGQFNGLLKEWVHVYVKDGTSHMPLFQGRIFRYEEKSATSGYGSNIVITCRDVLEELNQGDITGLSDDDDELQLHATGTSNYPTVNRNRGDIIKDVISKSTFAGGTSDGQIAFDQTRKFQSIHGTAFTAKEIKEQDKYKHKKHGHASPLKVVQNLATNDFWTVNNEERAGFSFYSDITRLSSLYSEDLKPQDMCYFRNGMYPTDTPTTYGLETHYATSIAIRDENPSGTDRVRNMFADNNFGGFGLEMFTDVSLKHKGGGEKTHGGVSATTFGQPNISDDEIAGVVAADNNQAIKTDIFTIVYVDDVDGDFSWQQGDEARTFGQVSSLHTVNSNHVYSGAGQTWLGDVQYQSGTGDNEYIILSNPQDHVLKNVAAGATMYEKRGAAGDAVTCTMVEHPASKHGFRRTKQIESTDTWIDNYDVLRKFVAKTLNKSTKSTDGPKYKGFMRIKDWPHVRWTNTAANGSSSYTLIPAGIAGEVSTATYGIQRGQVVTRQWGDNLYVGHISAVADGSVDVTMFREDQLADSSPTALNWSSGAPYNIYAPVRVGHIIRVDNPIVPVLGDHLVTSIEYQWSLGHVAAEITTVGTHDEAEFQSRANIRTSEGGNALTVNTGGPGTIEPMRAYWLGSGAYTASGLLWYHSHEEGESPTLAATDKRDYNTFSWSGGRVVVNDPAVGGTYVIKSGDTDALLTTAGYTSPMQPNIQYVLYLDRGDAKYGLTDSDGKFTLKIDQVTHDDNGYMRLNDHILVAYMTIGTNARAGKRTIGVPGSSYYSVEIDFPNGMPNVEFLHTFDNVLGVHHILANPDQLINNAALTTALLKEGAGRPWTSNLEVRGTAYNAISWDNGTANQAATLTFGNGDTVSITAGTKAAGSGEFGDNTTTYMYLDGTANGLTGAITPSFTQNNAIAHGDNKLLMGYIAIATSTKGDSPSIFIHNSKKAVINGGIITADAIDADHVQANTLGTNKLTVAARTEIEEKTITHVGNSAPSSPRTMDIWFDTSVTPTVIKVWDGNSWEVRNSNEPGGSKITQLTSAGQTPDANTGTPQSQGDMVVNIVDMLRWTWDLSIGGSNKWKGIIEADAINNATTTIEGGFINTQKIVLNDGGSSNTIFATGGVTGAPSPPPSNPGARVELDYTGLFGYSSSGTSNNQFKILSSNGKAVFGAGSVSADSNGLTIAQSGSSSSSFIEFGTVGGGTNNAFIQYYTGTNTGATSIRIGKIAGFNVEVVGSLVPGTSFGQSKLGGTYVNGANTGGWGGLYFYAGSGATPKLLTYDVGQSRLEFDGAAIGGGVSDHGALTGLSDNDHTQYSLGTHTHTNLNQNAWSTVDLDDDGGSYTGYAISADTTTDTFTLIAGPGITLHGNLTGDSIKISSSGGGGGDGIELDDNPVWTGRHSFTNSQSANTPVIHATQAPVRFDDAMILGNQASVGNTGVPTAPTNCVTLFAENDKLVYKDDQSNVTIVGGGVDAGTANTNRLAVYNSAGTNVEELLQISSGTIYGWETMGGGNIYPIEHGTVTVGFAYNGDANSDRGVKAFLGAHDNATGTPCFSFDQYHTTGFNFEEVTAANNGSGGRYYGHKATSAAIRWCSNDNTIGWLTSQGITLNTTYGNWKGINPLGDQGGRLGQGELSVVTAATDRRWYALYAYNGSFSNDLYVLNDAHLGWKNGAGLVEVSNTAGTYDDLYVRSRRMWFYNISAVAQSSGYVDLLSHSSSKGVWRESSSATVKKNIRPLEVDTSKIYDLQERTFETIPPEETDIESETAFGLIAEEVYETLPALAQLGLQNGQDQSEPLVPIGVDYKRLSVLLLTELRKLKERIEVLEGN